MQFYFILFCFVLYTALPSSGLMCQDRKSPRFIFSTVQWYFQARDSDFRVLESFTTQQSRKVMHIHYYPLLSCCKLTYLQGEHMPKQPIWPIYWQPIVWSFLPRLPLLPLPKCSHNQRGKWEDAINIQLGGNAFVRCHQWPKPTRIQWPPHIMKSNAERNKAEIII